MNLKKIIIDAIRSTIDESEVRSAVEDYICENIDMTEELKNSETLAELIRDNIEEAISDELDTY